MTSLNKKGTPSKGSVPNAVSYNGNPQFSKKDADQLYELIVMSLYGKDNYYESSDVQLQRLQELTNSVVSSGNFDFIANAALHARHVMNIRSMPIVLTVLFAKSLRDQKKHYANMRKLVCDVIARCDQLTDLYSFALSTFGSKKAIPMAIKRGVADATNKFGEYAYGKYDSKGAVKLKDILRIVHPTAKNEEQASIFEKIMKDTLAVPYTWETELSINGQKPESERKSKKDLWTELVVSEKLGYMALLRNLRNILDASVDPGTIATVAARLSNPDEVKKSKQLPFRFTNAITAVEGHSNTKLKTALSKAIDASLGNLPQIGENVWIIIDCSGSMNGTPFSQACLFAAALGKANTDSTNVKVTMFSDSAFHVAIDTNSSVLSIVDTLTRKNQGGGTNLQAALDMKPKLGFVPDTVIVLSDMQVDSLTSKDPAKLFGTDVVKVAINLQPYESTPLATVKGWYQLSGFSERLFDFIPAIRNKESVVSVLSVPYVGVKGIKTIVSDSMEEGE